MAPLNEFLTPEENAALYGAPSPPPALRDVVQVPDAGAMPVRVVNHADADLTAEQIAARKRMGSPTPTLNDYLAGTAGPHEVAATKIAPTDAVFPTMPQAKAPEGASGGQNLALLSLLGRGGGSAGGEVPVVSPARQQALERNMVRGQGIVGEQADAQAAAENAKAAAQQRAADEANDEADRQRQAADERARFAEQWQKQAQDDYDKLAKSKDVDPDRFWNAKSAGEKGGLGFLAAIAGLGMGWNHQQGPNPVVQAVNDKIGQDIRLQQESYERKKGLADRKNSLYAQMYAITGDKDEAYHRAFAAAQQAQIHHLDAVASRSNSPVIKANAKAAANQLQQEQIKTGIQFNKLVTGGGGVGAADIAKDRQHFIDTALANGHTPTQSEVDSYVAEKYGLAVGPMPDFAKGGSAKNLDAAGIPTFEANKQALEDLKADNGGEVPGSGLASRAVRGILGDNSIFLSSQARQARGALFSIAEQMAHANGQRGLEAIQANLHAIIGSGSDEDIEAGVQRAQAVIDARRKALGGGGGDSPIEDQPPPSPEGFEDESP